jgi:predicted nucleic-acid-binding Zn-ribbon protein
MMLKVNQDELDRMESGYAGIIEQIRRFEDASLPACPKCGSADTAAVQVGVVGRTISIVAATTKVKLVPNKRFGRCFCNECKEFFD